MTGDNADRTDRNAGRAQDAADRMIVGSSPVMAEFKQSLRLVARHDYPVLLQGESGTGKEVAARALHALSGDADRPFIAINCGAVPHDLMESELFGHERGSFTGAVDKRIGKFEAAAGGTLFLDEIGEMPHALQVRLLRVLETRQFERVGSSKTIEFTGRIVCATHRDLSTMVASGEFREDLWFRLAVLPLALPPLRARSGDIAALAAHIGQGLPGAVEIADDAWPVLSHHDWSGNVRELRNLLMRASIFCGDGILTAAQAESLLGIAHAKAAPYRALSAELPVSDLRQHLYDIEHANLVAALRQSAGVVAEAARAVGLSRTTFIDRLRRHGLNEDQDVAVSKDVAVS